MKNEFQSKHYNVSELHGVIGISLYNSGTGANQAHDINLLYYTNSNK